MSTATIQKRICLESKYLDNKIMDHLYTKLILITKDSKCTKDYGYITNIKSITRIIDHEISRSTCDNIFTVEFLADILNPQPGTTHIGTVCMIFSDGIFVAIHPRQRVLIPKSLLTEYEYKKEDKTFASKDTAIKQGDTLMVKITASKYNKKEFSCFGTLKEVITTGKDV